MKARSYSRREALGGLAAGTALLPLLEAGRASAQGYPRRILIVIHTNGVIQEKFWPQQSGSGTDLSTAVFPEITASLEPYRSDLLFIRGVTAQNYRDVPSPGGPHYSYNGLFTGAKAKRTSGPELAATSKSIDQAIADEIAKKTTSPLRSLHLGVLRFGSAHNQVCFHRGEDAPIIPESDPRRVLDKFVAGGAGGGAALERIRAERRSVLDIVGRDLTRFAGRLGTEDRLKVDTHLQSVREIEKQIASTKTVTCNGPTVSTADPFSATNYPQTLNSQMDLVVAAFKCDLTRVATIQTANHNGDTPSMRFPWLPGLGMHFHHYAHNLSPGKVAIDTWFAQQFAGLIKRFKAVPEGGGTMLDNSVILFANHMGDGAAHTVVNLPWVLAGSCGGHLKTRQLIQANSTTNRVMIGLANAMGLPITTFGDPAYGSGPAPGMTA